MVNQFEVIDTVVQHWEARGSFPARTDHMLICLDKGECPMRQMPRYLLDTQNQEVEKFAGGQLNGKLVKIEVREMNGRGNPTMKGRVIGVVNGVAK